MTWNVGFLGSGPGVAALHLPTLSRLEDTFRVVHVADAGSGRAQALAGPLGARSSAGDLDLLADPGVDVVAVCTPPAEHGRQILAAVAAGKRAVFCEKPLATGLEETGEIVAACRDSGTALFVGTNHHHDPAWQEARRRLRGMQGPVVSVSATLALPPNDRYHSVVAESAPFPVPSRGRPDTRNPEVAADVVRQLLTGLAIHDLPAIREFAPNLEEIVYARFVPPLGYAVGYRASGVTVQLALTMLPGGPDALWRLTFSTPRERLDLNYPPAFVHAGSGALAVLNADGTTIEVPPVPEDGYLAEWRRFAELLDGTATVDFDQILAEARYPLELAGMATAKMLSGVLR